MLFILYIFALVGVVFFKFPTSMGIVLINKLVQGETLPKIEPKLVPFQVISEYVKMTKCTTDWYFKNLMCNIVMFIPYGFLLPFKYDYSHRLFGRVQTSMWVYVMVTGALVSIATEIVQYITRLGQCDIDDVILNVLGIAIGFAIYKIFFKVAKQSTKEEELPKKNDVHS